MINKNMFVKPKIALEGQKNAPDHFEPSEDKLTACPSCKHAIFAYELRELLYVCPRCGHHFMISARERIRLIADQDTFWELNSDIGAKDRLGFPQYEEKLKKARENSGESEAVLTGMCGVDGVETALFVMESQFMMGSMSASVGEKIARLFEFAEEKSLPVVGYTVSGGARVQEGMLSLMQMAKTSAAVRRHSDAGLFYLTILTDPTTGGVTASFAMEGDIILAEPGALIGFAGPRVIEQTMRQTLPEGFQRAEFLLKKGFVDQIVARYEQRYVIGRLLKLHDGAKEGVHESI